MVAKKSLIAMSHEETDISGDYQKKKPKDSYIILFLNLSFTLFYAHKELVNGAVN